MTFRCTSSNLSVCPSSYMVLFHGPSRQVVLPEMFSSIDRKIGKAKWTIQDPGEYSFYAYPEFIRCHKWVHMEYPWHAASVQNTPRKILVRGVSAKDGREVCSTDDARVGRYLPSNSSELSKYTYTNILREHPPRTFAWAPYKCKIPPRSIHDALKAIPSMNHILFMGDSTVRTTFCFGIWEQILV